MGVELGNCDGLDLVIFLFCGDMEGYIRLVVLLEYCGICFGGEESF